MDTRRNIRRGNQNHQQEPTSDNHTYRATELEHHATEDRRRRPCCREGVCDKRVGLCEDGHQEKHRSGGPLTESEPDQRHQPIPIDWYRASELEHGASWNQGWRHGFSEIEVCLGWEKHPWGQRRSTTSREEQSGQRRADGLSRGRLGVTSGASVSGVRVWRKKFSGLCQNAEAEQVGPCYGGSMPTG